MGSTRLPGKILKPLLGRPLLEVLLERVTPATKVDRWVVATTLKAQDDVVEALAAKASVACFRGSEYDVLDRYYQAAKQYQARTIARLTADNPLMDGAFVDWVVGEYQQQSSDCDFVTTSHEGLPLGMSMEVLPFSLLERLWHEDTKPESREHVTTLLYTQPDGFRALAVRKSDQYTGMRWTVDEEKDYELVSRIFDAMGRVQFPWEDAAAMVLSHPEWSEINRDVRQRTV